MDIGWYFIIGYLAIINVDGRPLPFACSAVLT